MATLNPRLSRSFLACALPLGLAYALVNAPFAVEHELGHLARVDEIADGILVPRHDAQGGWQEVPAAYVAAAQRTSAVLADPGARVDHAQLRQDLGEGPAMVPEPPARVRTARPPRLYTPFPYLAYLPAAWLARLLELPPLWHLYLARFAGVLSYSLVCACAVALAGELGWLFFVIGLIPALITEAAGVSADGMTNALSLLFFALLFRSAQQGPVADPRRLLPHGVLLCLLACCKPVYLPLALALPVLSPPTVPARVRFAPALLALLLGTLLTLSWAQLVPKAFLPSGSLVTERALWLLTHPWRALRTARLTFFRRADETLIQLFAIRHTLSDQLRFTGAVVFTIYTQLLGLLAAGALGNSIPRDQTRALTRWLAFSTAFGAVSIVFGVYCLEDAPAIRVFSYLRGRYFAPLLPAACAAFFGMPPIAKRWLSVQHGYRIILLVLALNLFCLFALFGRYHAPPDLDFPI